MGTGKLRLSQCMIVKNEERNIEKALSWGKEIMWEQIVVDTGSTDRTVEIAERMGAKVFHFAWIDDFAAAKNFAIEQASGNWIAFLDADEYMEPEDMCKVPAVIKKAEKLGLEGLYTLCLQVGDDQSVAMVARQCRIFRNTKKIRYDKPIHECLYYEGKNMECHMLDATGLSIYHTGYISELSEAKSRRNIGILLKELRKNPQDPDLLGYLGDAYRGVEEEKEKALQYYREALPHIFARARTTERDVQTIALLMTILMKQDLEQELMEVYRKASAQFTGFYDLDYLAGRFYLEKQDYQKAEHHFEKALAGAEQYGTKAYNPMMSSDIPEVWKALAFCYYKNGKIESCVSSCVGLLRIDKGQVTALELLIRCFKEEDPQAVVGFLCKLYNLNDITDRILMLRGAISAGAEGEGVLQAIRGYCTEEELRVLDKRKE